MASIINASSTGSGGIVQTADASGVLQLQNNGNITVTFDASSNMGLGTASPSARMSVLLSNSTAYANTSPSASNCTAAFINTASHVSGGTFVGYQLNISGDSQNRIGYFGAISGSSSDQALSLVFGVNSGAGSRAEALRINSNANVILQGGTTTASGVGLTFPATQVASTDANCLDDYEEGTWTPVVKFGSTTATLTSASASYTKIGRVVTLMIEAYVTNLNGGTGSFSLTNFPFNAYSYNRQTVAQFYFQFMSATFPAGDKFAFISPNDSTLGVNYFTGASGTAGNLDNTHFTTSSYVYASIIYFAP